MTRRKLLKVLTGAAAMAVLPMLPEKKYGRIPCRSPLGRKVAYVTCDGAKVDHAFDADDVEGWVDHFKKVDGRLFRLSEGGPLAFRKVGVVKFHWREPRAELPNPGWGHA